MSADPADVTRVPERAIPVNEPLYLPSSDHKLFAWLNWPAGEQTSEVGLVICKPFGYEAICAHRSLRAFAATAAATGAPTLSFDYLGSGDSADIDPEADQIEEWCRNVVAAIDELRRRTGVGRVCLLGFRLGALLATLAARQTNTVDSLILVAPVISGRRYLGEMRITRAAALLGVNVAASGKQEAGDPARAGDGSMEVSGHHVSAATISALSRIDLATLGAPPVSRILIIDRSDLPAAARTWAESLPGLGVPTEYAALPGFVEMMMTAPQFTRIPHEMIALAREWLLRCTPRQTADARPRRGRDLAVHQAALLSLPGNDSASDARLSERPVQFGSEVTLFGIVTEPCRGEIRRRAVILLNAGGDYHICVGRMYVSLARRWARSGYVVLRMDLAGLGDSGTRPGRPDNEIFPPAAIDDIRAAIAFMRDCNQVDDVSLVGLCSGAYHALRAAIKATPLNRILLVNPESFFWRDGATLEDIQLVEVVSTRSVYGERMRSLKHWRKMLAGQVDIWRITRLYLLRFLLSLTATLRDVFRHLQIRLPNDLGWELEQIAARGVQITMVFARGEPGIELLRLQGGSSIRRVGERCRVHIIDGADHTFSREESRAVLERILSDELFRASRPDA